MTNETRETLTAIVRKAEAIIESWPSVIVIPNVGIGPKEAAALRGAANQRRKSSDCGRYLLVSSALRER